MILAELEVYHSRPVAPTRRVALGRANLPVEPPPGFGGILLGGIVAANIGAIDPDLIDDLTKLTQQLEHGMSISQPRLRHRFQRDRVGLQRSRHRLLSIDDDLRFEFDDAHGDPAQQVLGAVYAAGNLPPRTLGSVMSTVRRGIAWQGPIDQELIAALSGFNSGAAWSAHALTNPVEWALEVLQLDAPEPAGAGTGGANGSARANGASGANGASSSNGANGANGSSRSNGTGAAARATRHGIGPSRGQIQQAYRRLLIEAHPDHGGLADDAAQRIADLTEARRILLG